MSTNKVITENDLTNILNKVLPSGYNIQLDAVYAEVVTASINKAAGSDTVVTAPNVAGYKFLCWAQIATNGWVGSVYPSDLLNQTTNVWNASTGQSGTGNIDCLALYISEQYTNSQNITIADYIVEQGTSGIWTYRKWNSGLAECWSTQSWASKAITTTYGHGYYAAADTISLPSGLFTTVSNVQATSRDTAGYGTWFNVTNVSTSSVVGYMYSVSSVTTGCSLSLYVVGKWK